MRKLDDGDGNSTCWPSARDVPEACGCTVHATILGSRPLRPAVLTASTKSRPSGTLRIARESRGSTSAASCSSDGERGPLQAVGTRAYGKTRERNKGAMRGAASGDERREAARTAMVLFWSHRGRILLVQKQIAVVATLDPLQRALARRGGRHARGARESQRTRTGRGDHLKKVEQRAGPNETLGVRADTCEQ